MSANFIECLWFSMLFNLKITITYLIMSFCVEMTSKTLIIFELLTNATNKTN